MPGVVGRGCGPTPIRRDGGTRDGAHRRCRSFPQARVAGTPGSANDRFAPVAWRLADHGAVWRPRAILDARAQRSSRGLALRRAPEPCPRLPAATAGRGMAQTARCRSARDCRADAGSWWAGAAAHPVSAATAGRGTAHLGGAELPASSRCRGTCGARTTVSRQGVGASRYGGDGAARILDACPALSRGLPRRWGPGRGRHSCPPGRRDAGRRTPAVPSFPQARRVSCLWCVRTALAIRGVGA